MKIKVTKKAFYKNALLEEGKVINFPDKEPMPSWGTLASGEEQQATEGVASATQSAGEKTGTNVKDDDAGKIGFNLNIPDDKKTPDDENEEKDGTTPDDASEQSQENTPDDNSEVVNEEQLKEELNKIIDIAVANEIWLDIPAEVSIADQINLFKDAIKEKGIELH